MLCEQVDMLLTGYVLGEISPADQLSVQAHLEQCPACREQLHQLQAALRVLQEAIAAEPLPTLTPSRRAALQQAAVVAAGVAPASSASAGSRGVGVRTWRHRLAQLGMRLAELQTWLDRLRDSMQRSVSYHTLGLVASVLLIGTGVFSMMLLPASRYSALASRQQMQKQPALEDDGISHGGSSYFGVSPSRSTSGKDSTAAAANVPAPGSAIAPGRPSAPQGAMTLKGAARELSEPLNSPLALADKMKEAWDTEGYAGRTPDRSDLRFKANETDGDGRNEDYRVFSKGSGGGGAEAVFEGTSGAKAHDLSGGTSGGGVGKNGRDEHKRPSETTKLGEATLGLSRDGKDSLSKKDAPAGDALALYRDFDAGERLGREASREGGAYGSGRVATGPMPSATLAPATTPPATVVLNGTLERGGNGWTENQKSAAQPGQPSATWSLESSKSESSPPADIPARGGTPLKPQGDGTYAANGEALGKITDARGEVAPKQLAQAQRASSQHRLRDLDRQTEKLALQEDHAESLDAARDISGKQLEEVREKLGDKELPQEGAAVTEMQAQKMEARQQQLPQSAQQLQGVAQQMDAQQALKADVAHEDVADAEPAEAPVLRFKEVPVNPWVLTAVDKLSTFALNVDTASFALARNYLRQGKLPPAGAVRMEEFVNAFDYQYPRRIAGPKDPTFNIYADAAPSPFASPAQNLTLLKIGVQAKVIGREERKPAHLIFVIDTSGSMARADRLPRIQEALDLLLEQLQPGDRVSLVSFGSNPRLLAQDTAVDDNGRRMLRQTIDGLQCQGSTNLMDGLKLGYQVALNRMRPGAINRVVLCSDGVANIGAVDAQAMLQEVDAARRQGVAFTAVGVGMGAYNDELLQQLADKGDGNYWFVDSKQEARRVLVEQLSGTLQLVAKDARIQVEFNPNLVRKYRLIGYESRDIADEKFRDDTIQAGGIGSGQHSTALYEVELMPEALDDTGRVRESWAATVDLGTVYVRYRDADTGKINEISRRLEPAVVQKRTVTSDPRFYLAASAAQLAEILRASEHAKDRNLQQVQGVLREVCQTLPRDAQARELLGMVDRARGLVAGR